MKRDKRRVPYPPCGVWNSSRSGGSKNRRAARWAEINLHAHRKENVCHFFLLNTADWELISHWHNFCKTLYGIIKKKPIIFGSARKIVMSSGTIHKLRYNKFSIF